MATKKNAPETPKAPEYEKGRPNEFHYTPNEDGSLTLTKGHRRPKQ